MRVTIKGLTDSTITFNTLGIILRGNSAKPELYPNSIARHIDINNDAQMRELITLKNAKLVSVIDESAVQAQPQMYSPPMLQTPVITPVVPKPSQAPKPPPVEMNVIKAEEIEDMPSVQPEEEEEEILTVSSKKKTGRPKKVKETKTPKTTKKVVKEPKNTVKASPIKRSKNFGTPLAKDGMEDDSKIVVMTPNGPITGKAANNMAGEMPESEATRASIEALRQMEEEEAVPESLVDESKLDISQRMGTSAVVATGENSVQKIAMRNSILPEAEAIKARGIKFIDPTGDGNPIDDGSELDESIKDIFIDDDGDDGKAKEDGGDSFIEI